MALNCHMGPCHAVVKQACSMIGGPVGLLCGWLTRGYARVGKKRKIGLASDIWNPGVAAVTTWAH